MSTDSPFATLEYPALHDREYQRRAARAVADGHAAGYAAGMRAAQRELERERERYEADAAAAARALRDAHAHHVAALTAAAEALRRRADELTADAQQVLLESTVALSEAVLGVELRDGEHAAKAALQRVLNHTDAGEAISIRLHPDDAALLREALSAPSTADGERAREGGCVPAVPAVPIVDDATLERGDAIADLPQGWLDARLRAAFERAKTCLDEVAP